MADELPNSAALRRDNDFRDWMLGAIGYQARQVILNDTTGSNDYAVRRALANASIVDPAVHVDKFINVIATDPAVASKGTTVQQVTQATMLAKVAEVWTPLAKLLYS